MADYAVNTAFNASGDILRTLTNMTNRVDKFGRRASNSFGRASKSASQFKSTMMGVLAAGAVNKMIGSLNRGLSSVTTQFIEYDQAIVSASAKFKGLNLQTEKGVQTMTALKKTARDLGATTEFSASQAAQGLDFLAMAGFNAEQAMAGLPAIVDLATVANIDLARATDIASDALGAYGLATDDSAQLQKNFIRTSDLMAQTVTMANTDMESLFATIQKGASTFVNSGQSMETFNALAGSLANNSLKGGEAGTLLRNVMLRLAKPTGQASDLLKKLNIQTQDSKGNFKDVIDILGDFEKGLEGMGTAQKSAALKTIFGDESINGFNLLLSDGTEKLKGYRQELLNSAGASKRMADVMRGSIGNQLKSLGSAATELGFKFVDAFDGKIAPAIESLTMWVRNFNVSPIVTGLMTVINVVLALKEAIYLLVGAMVAYKAIMIGMGMVSFIKNLILVTRFIKAAYLAQGLWNTIMMLNPIGLIIAGVTAFIGIIWGLWAVIKKVAGWWFGGDDDNEFADEATAKQQVAQEQASRVAPNQTQVESQQVNFNGQLNIVGAPEGSTFDDNSGVGPQINTEFLGEQM